MNCHNFELVINDLARNQIMDAAAKSLALAHADTCARCAARLGDEKALTAGLGSLAASMKSEAASPRVEEMLRAALREKEAVASVRPRRLPRRAIAAAIIAVILAAVALIALNLKRSPAPVQAKNPTEVKQPEQPNVTSPDNLATGSAPQQDDNQIKTPQNNSPQKIAHQRRAATGVARNQKSNPRPIQFNGPPRTNEVATDFIPLMHGESLNQMDGGQLVRVELPRSALIRFGLPMNMERASERIKADVVIGNDGLARAIRFVR